MTTFWSAFSKGHFSSRSTFKVPLPRALLKTTVYVPVKFLSHIYFNIYFYLFIWLLTGLSCPMWDLWSLLWSAGSLVVAWELIPMFWLLLPVMICHFQTRSQLFPIKFGLFPPWTWILVDVAGFYHHPRPSIFPYSFKQILWPQINL